MNQDIHGQQGNALPLSNTSHSVTRTLQVFLTALTMLFAVGVQGVWAFTDFEIDLTKNPVGDLPAGVTQISYPKNGAEFNGAQHGWQWYAIEFDVDGPVRVTIGGCQYINAGYEGYVTDGSGNKLGDIANKTAACYDADPVNNVGTYNYIGGAGTLKVFCGQYCSYIKVEKTEAPADPTLTVAKTSANVFVPSYMSSNTASVTLTGSNLTDGTYQVTQPSVDGLTISPTQFTVTDGAVNQNFTISYTSAVAVASASADFTFATSDGDMSVAVNATYGKTTKRNVEQAIVSEATTWDFTGIAAANIQLQGNTTPAYNEEFIYATLGEVKNDAEFNAAALKVTGQWAYYQGNAQVNTIKFTTTVPGTVEVTFHPGTSANRTLYINGKSTGTSTSSAYVTGSATVGAGEVVISGKDDGGNAQSLRISKIVFTPSAAPTPEIPTFSLTEEQSVISTKTPTEWESVQLPQIPEITQANTTVVSGLVADADNTTALQAALDAVPAEGGMVIIPAGEWLSGPLTIKSKTVLHLSKNTTLKMLPYGTYPQVKEKCLITTADGGASDVVIEGEDYTSIIDGQGVDWWNALENNSSLVRPSGLIRFNKGARYLVRNLQLQNAPNTNLQLGNSGNASHFTVHDVKIVNPASDEAEATADGFSCNSHNTDGIPVWGPYCNIYKCNISTGDDNIVFDSDSQYGHVWDCDFGRGHGASIGSYTVNVHDILWDNIRFNGTESGFKVKSQRGRSGDVYNITAQNSTMTNVRDILYLDCWYDQSTKPAPGTALEEAAPAKNTTTPAFRDITFKNITATDCVYKSSDKNGFTIYFYGLPESHIKNVTLDNVTIEGQKGMFMAYVGENEANGVTFQNGCNISNVREPSAAAFVTDYSAVHNDDYVTIPATEKIWNFSDWDAVTVGNMENPTIKDGLSIFPVYDSNNAQKSAIDANNKSIDGYSFTKRFKFGGKSTSAATGTGYMKFDVFGPTDIVVYGMCGSSTVTTDIILSKVCRSTTDYLHKWESVSGSSISKNEYSYTGEAATLYLYCDVNSANIYMIKATPVSTPIDPDPIAPEWESIEMTLNTAGLLTSAEISSKESVDFGISVDNAGKVIRVEKGASNAIGSISGNYHSDHGMTGFSLKLNEPGAVKITAGTCTYGTTQVKINGTAVGDAVVGGGNNGPDICWKNSRSNVTTGIYTGAAGELTITTGSYTPYIKVEKYNAANEPQADSDGIYDAVVTNLTQLKAALNHSGTAERQYKILVKNGTYDFGTDIQTPVKSYISLIGESRDGVIIKNEPTQEGIQTSVLLLVNGTGTDIENMTLQCSVANSGNGERSVVIWDKGQDNIFRNLKLVGRQDTYSSDGKPEGAKSYFEDCHIQGTVDFICGNGNVMFENCILDLQKRDAGDVIAAPSTYASETGFVFNNCTIQGDSGQEGKYYLARGWKNDPKASFFNTTMKITPSLGGISPSNASNSVNSKTWKEYGSKNASGAAANVTSSVISESDASAIISSVVGTLGTDESSELIELSAPIIADNKLKWKSDTRAIGYIVYKNGTKVATISASNASSARANRAPAATEDMEYAIDDASATWSVSAINAKGAVGKAAAPVEPGPEPEPSYPITATWDFQNAVPSTITSVSIEGNAGDVASDKDGINLAVNATTGKLQYNASGYAQFNQTTTIHVPVTSKYDVVTVVAFPGQHNYTIGGIAATSDNANYTALDADVTNGYVEIKATATAYIYSITVTQQGAGYVPAVDWTPTWDATNNRWVVKTSDNADAAMKATENAKGFTEALKHLNVAANVEGKNKTLYIPNGTYDLGETALTSVPADFHLIGESQNGVIIKNQLPFESIKYTATLKITGANVTLENMTIKCRATYGKEKRDDAGTIADSNAERGVCVQDCGNGTHYINVTLDGLQDTYYSNGAAGMTATFDNCIVRGNVDFFCGNGDITVNNSRLQIVSTHGSGGTAVICAPATYTTETQGYLFDNCIVETATSAVNCLVSGHSSSVKFALARGWYAGNGGTDRTPRVTFKDTEFEIKPYENWTTMSDSQPGGAPVFQIINTGIQFSDEAMVINKTNKPFAYATATDRTNPASVSESNITGGGEYDLETIMEKMEAGDGYTVGETKTISGHKAIVLRSANTVTAGKETRVPMDAAIKTAITNNDIIVLDGSGTSTDFVVSKYIQLSRVQNKTIVGINGARLCTEWYLTDYFKSLLENVPTSSGTGVNSASTTSGGGSIEIIRNGQPYTDNIPEEGEYLTRKTLLEATGDKTESYRYSGIFYIDHSSNLIIRNFKFIGPGSLDCAGYDLMAIIDDTHHCWVDHCEFIDGMDGNFDITNRSDFVTVSWCQFRYTDRSYAHQNTNLVGSSDDKTDDRGKLNITFAYNEWGANCRARMPMARYGRIHMLNNYYNCAGNSEYAMNPRKESEFLIEGNYWEKGVRRTYNPSGQSAITWGNNNYYADNAAANAGSSMGSTVTVPYQYSALVLDPHKVPEVLSLNGGAKLYQKPYFTTNLGVVDTDKTAPYEYTTLLSETEADGLTFSVWAENAHTFQWYMQDIALDGTAGEWTMIDDENRNTYTYKPQTGITFNLKCKAFGVSGETESDVLKVTVDGESKPIYITDLDDAQTYNVISGSPQIFTVNAGTDGVTYQWYKSANADGSDATAIPSATDRSYTYNPTATTGEIVYLFCRATNQQGSTDSKIIKVKGIYRNVKFHMYATYDANDKNSSVYVEGGTSNINNVGTTSANIAADSDGCKAEVNRTKDISGLRFENAATSTHTNPLGVSAHFTPTTAIADGDKIEVSINTSSTSSANTNYGFYVCKAAELGTENANVIGTITVNGNALKTQTFTATEAITDLYLIPFVGGAEKNINLANVVVYTGAEVRPVDDPVFITDLEEEYKVKVGQRQTLSVEVDENDVQGYQWYKNTTKTATVDEAHKIADATSASYDYTASAEGTEYLYCVVTGKKPDTSITSTVAAVIATAANDKEPLIWIFDDYCKDKNVAAGAGAEIAENATEIVSSSNGKNLSYVAGSGTKSVIYNKTDGSGTIGDMTFSSYLYMGGSGSSSKRYFLTDALSGSGTLTVYYTQTVNGELQIYDNANTSSALATATPVKTSAVEIKLKNLNDTQLRIAHTGKCYIYGISWTPNQATVMEKGIYSTTFSDWKTDKTATDDTNRASNTTITQEIKTKSNETITFTLNNCAVDNSAYYKIKEQSGVTTPGCVVAMKSNATYNGTITSTTFDNITKIEFVESVSGTNRGMGLKVKGTKEDGTTDSDWVVISDAKVETGNARKVTVDVNRTNVQIQFYNLVPNQYGGLTNLVIYGMMELMSCEEPTYEETWSGDENEKWIYDFESATETAHLKYTIDDGAEQTIESNKGRVSVNPGQKISIWAIDSEETLPNSPVVEVTAPAKKATATPNLNVSVYDVANHNYPVTISGADAEAKVYYTTDGSEPTASSTLYTGPFTVGQEVTVKAIAIRAHYADSPVLTYTTVAINLPQKETFKTTGAGSNDAETKGIKNILNPAEIDGKYISGIDGKTGLKYTINGATDQVDADGTTKINGIQIDVHNGYVITELDFADTYCNTSGKNIKLTRVFVDGVAIPGFEAKTIPNSPKSNFKIENIAATQRIVLEIIPDADVNQARAAISPIYEFVETPVSATVDGVAFTEEQNNALKNDHEVVIADKLFAENPVIVVTTDKGYEYTLQEDPSGTDGEYTRLFKKFVGQEYVVKVKVNAIKSPYITIGEDLSLAGGYKVTLTGIDYTKTTPYINIDGKVDSNGDLVWEEYDKDKSYYALKEVKTRSGYTDEQTQTSLYTDPRSASCPSNSYEAGKPFAVYLYVNGYQDNQVGAQIYNNNSLATDKIHKAIANQFNVIDLQINNSEAILDKRPDITDAKLVIITETLGGSGSVEIAGVGNKSNMMALTLKRDVLDKTNVLNLKMFMNGSSSANNQRWQWAQPRAMSSELTSIMPCTPDGGGMYEIFGNATMSRDASINLWDDVSTENMLYHLQPVFNFNEENETRPNFIPLALVIDPEEPEDEREEYHAIHTYAKNGFQYIAFGLSVNEWPQYNNNVYAIIDKIGEMIIAGKSLDSKLTGIVKPTVTDNGDGSANVFNNNLNADTYYVVYTQSEYEALGSSAPGADDIISGSVVGHQTYHANATDFQTQKFTAKMHIFAVSKLGTDATSEVVEGTVEGNSIRYVIRENDDPAAQGMVANYPFDLTVNSGTFNMPYNQSWKKDGYTVTKWISENGTEYTPGQEVSGLTQDITVKAVWTENTKAVTDLGKNEDKAHRTVTWEFLQSKGAPAIAMENKAGNMQAILVGQAKFSDGTFIDVPMTINTDNLATLPDNGTEYHGKFNNTSTNWAKTLIDNDKEFTGSDYAQVRTGTQFLFPAVYGMNVVYKQIDLVEAVNGEANGNVNRSQVSQSFLTDGTKTADALKNWRFVNPGFQLDANRKIVMVDGVAQLAKTSPMYQAYGEKGRELGLYDEENGGNHVNGGLIYYTGDGTQATLTSMESAQYIHVGAATGKPLGGLNSGSVFMQSLSVTYPELYDLTCTWNPAKSELDPEENPGKIEKLNDPRPNCGGRYVLNDDINLKLTPAYGYYVDVDNDEVKSGDVVTKEAYYFLKNGMSATSPLDITNGGVIKTSAIYRYKDAGYDSYSDDIKANIPEDGAYITMKVMDIDLVVSMKKWPTVKYNVAAEPSTFGYVTFNSGNGRPHEDEYEEFPVGKRFYITAHPNTNYKFKEWRRKTNEGLGEKLVSKAEYDAIVGDKKDYYALPVSVTFGDGDMVNPFDKNDYLETNELLFVAGTDNYGNNDNFTYVAVFEKAVTGTGYYEFDYALLKTVEGQAHTDMTPIEVTPEDRNQFPSEFTSQLLNFPKYFTLFKPGYTLDHWVEISGKDEIVDEKHVFTPGTFDGDAFTPSTEGNYTFGKSYNPGSFYNFETEGEVKHLVPVFTKNVTSYDYRATPVDITWDLRVAQRAQRVDFKSGTNGNTAADTKIYYSTQATINGDVHIDVPLTITLGKKGKLVNVIEEEDKWCAMGEGTTIQIPSGLGAKFTIASLSKMETTSIDDVVPTSYTVENIDGANVYLYTYTTQSEATSVTLKIGDDYSYYKYIRAELPAADAVPFTTTVNNPAFGSVEITAARTTADVADNETLLKKINATKISLPQGEGQGRASYTLGLGTIVSLHAKREHLYVLDYFEDGDGHKYYYNKDDETKHLTVKDKDGKDITAAATAADEFLKMEKVQDFNTLTSLNDLQLTFQVQSYSESMHAVYKENTLYQVNYTSGEEAEGEAPGMTLVEDGESFTVPAENHHLYVDGQTLRYWVDEAGNRYELSHSYTTNKDLFLSPVFKVNDFTVMNLSNTATATWPLSRKGTASYAGNGDIVINFEGINGIYVTPLKVTDAGGNVIDFIDLKMDIRGENGKANNVNSSDRCQINSGTVFGVPSSSNCTFTLKSANNDISAKIDGTEVSGQQTVSSNYTGDKTQIDINFTGNTYLYAVEAQYKPVTTELPELDYATVGNISLGALGTPLASVKLSTLKSAGEVSGVPADLSNSTTGIMPVVRGTATRGGYVEVTQATIDNPVATMLVKTQDGVTVSVYKIGFTVTYPNIAPRVTDLKIDRKHQCDLKKMYEKAIEDTRVDGTNYINDNAYLRHLGVDGENAANERVNVNGVINIKFSTKMAEATIPASTFQANGTGKALGQAVSSLEGQTLTFTYTGLAVNTEYDFIIPAGTFKDVFWAESTEENKPNHVYNEDIRIHFSTVKTAITTERRVINYVVTHNQASHFDATEAKMVADGEPVQVASDELIANLEAAGIEHGTLDEGVKLANAYTEAGKRFYIFVPDGEYQLMGNDFVKSVSSPIGEDGKVMTLGKTENVYSGITTISKDNVSITGQSQEKTIVYNHPVFEGLSNASTLKLNGGIANFYAQDMTIQNKFDFLRCRKVSSKAVAPALWDRSQKPIFKNVKFDSYQDTYYTNANNQLDDTRGYAEDCTIMGYVDFICGDGDHWFQNSNMVVRQGVGSTATNMFAPRQYDTQKWGYVLDHCTFSAENSSAFDVNNGKMTIARPWANSPAETLIECTYDVLSTDDGYKKMTGGGLIMRMQEYKSYDSYGKILDLSKRSLRNSTPGIGSYDAVMTPSKAAEYNLYNVMGGEDGYDPTLYTAQVDMPKANGIKQDDTFLTWDDQKEALCYFLFISDTKDGDYKLFAVTDGTEFEMDNAQINKWFIVRAANQRGGLGAPTDKFQYKAHESYKRELVNNTQVIYGWRWSTIYLDFDAKAPVVQHDEIVDGEMKTVDDIYVYALVKVDATKLTFKRVKIMEKNCGYLIKARPRPEEYEFKYTEKTPVYWNDQTVPEYRTAQALSATDFPHMSLMNGSVTNKPSAGTAGYTLASKTSYGLGFYKYVGSQYNANYAWLDAALVAEAQKAMADGSLDAPARAGFMRMVFDDDLNETDDITDIYATNRETPHAVYNLAGQRINPSQMHRGEVYIIDGQKVVAK